MSPPWRTGLRGSHPGAFEAAHALRDGSLSNARIEDTGEIYDLVVVGGGLSGLASAHFFRKYAGPESTVLIVENHDDFGGHAKRNAFNIDGHELVLNGGTLEIESPQRYNQWAEMVLADIGVDLTAYRRENIPMKDLYEKMGLKSALFFNHEVWNHDSLMRADKVPGEECWRYLSPSSLSTSPLSDKVRQGLIRLVSQKQPDYLASHGLAEKKSILSKISYLDYLIKIAKIDPDAARVFQKAGSGVFCVGADALPALFAWVMGYPGFSGLGLGNIPEGLLSDLQGGQHGRQKESEKTVHFPDGNATLARLLVAHLVPDATSAQTQDDMGVAEFRYENLDKAGQKIRIRLNTLAVSVTHDGTPEAAGTVSVLCAQAGDATPQKIHHVRGRQVVMACWNMIIPYLIPELPTPQKEALAYGTKGPIVYVNVALKNWQSFRKLGVSEINCPGMFFESIELAEPVSLGRLHAPENPDHPVVIRMIRTFGMPGLSKRDQHRAGRSALLATTFEQFEQEIRSQLQRVLEPGGFDEKRDIAAITVNRWPHGYAYTYNSLYEPADWVFTETSSRPCVTARQPFGRIAIANSDAAASPHTDAAFEQAHRAVIELLERQTFPMVSSMPGASTL
ncbi:spermidine dehydrogenase SpdH [Acetobacter oeni]|uniref:Spermidine dehydrogenase SpdH n=1 Tax=Acetobacter oeni TaxID=304077 RepID=A0A511XFS1_9PROT|nr:hypothetical protein AA21952_0308 [Acetobacter oeni LMG 21952]GEN61789.1 spermidine dehydrogenase SpdH [Acetobacter oeni]